MSPISRRQLLMRAGLAGAGILGAAGIGGAAAALVELPARDHPTAAPAPGAATVPELAAALAREQQLLAGLDAALAADPSRTVLTAIRADHLAHLNAIAALAGAGPPATPSVTSSPGSSPTPGAAAPGNGQLSAAEQAAQQAAASAAGSLRGTGAVLLASIAACEAGHVEMLS